MISFIRFVNDLIIFVVMGFIIGWYLYQVIFKNKTPQKIEDFPYFDITQKKFNTKDLLLSNLCYTLKPIVVSSSSIEFKKFILRDS